MEPDVTIGGLQSTVPTVTARENGGDVTVNVTDPKRPQSVSGVLFRFDDDTSPGIGIDQFRTDKPTARLGAAAEVDGKLFSVEGRVIAFGDSPPSPYEVVVTVLQDGNVLHTKVPPNGGKGTVGDDDQPFEYSFRLRAA